MNCWTLEIIQACKAEIRVALNAHAKGLRPETSKANRGLQYTVAAPVTQIRMSIVYGDYGNTYYALWLTFKSPLHDYDTDRGLGGEEVYRSHITWEHAQYQIGLGPPAVCRWFVVRNDACWYSLGCRPWALYLSLFSTTLYLAAINLVKVRAQKFITTLYWYKRL